jgi:hypothetical protein
MKMCSFTASDLLIREERHKNFKISGQGCTKVLRKKAKGKGKLVPLQALSGLEGA